MSIRKSNQDSDDYRSLIPKRESTAYRDPNTELPFGNAYASAIAAQFVPAAEIH